MVCLGTGQQVEAEGRDRLDLVLPGQQAHIIEDLEDYGRFLPLNNSAFHIGEYYSLLSGQQAVSVNICFSHRIGNSACGV